MTPSHLLYLFILADTPIPDDKLESFTSSPTHSFLAGDSSLPYKPANLRAEIVRQTFVTLTWSARVEPGQPPIIKYTVTTKEIEDLSSRLVFVYVGQEVIDSRKLGEGWFVS